ncbi:hypothetical protein P4110_17085 [Pseudomonas aeruginosa]|nr:hypothetical protein [Pseudomonas aeruginosa]
MDQQGQYGGCGAEAEQGLATGFHHGRDSFGMSVGYAVGRFVEARKQAGNQRLRMGTEFPTLKGLTVRRSRRFNETAMLVP